VGCDSRSLVCLSSHFRTAVYQSMRDGTTTHLGGMAQHGKHGHDHLFSGNVPDSLQHGCMGPVGARANSLSCERCRVCLWQELKQ
jgi:hypothetical protein